MSETTVALFLLWVAITLPLAVVIGHIIKRADELQKKYDRLTDRDERGRFVKRNDD